MVGRKILVRGKGSLGLRKSAQEVLDNIGGANNVVSAARCATRLLPGIMSALNFMGSNDFIALGTDNCIYKIADLVSGMSFGILLCLAQPVHLPGGLRRVR